MEPAFPAKDGENDTYVSPIADTPFRAALYADANDGIRHLHNIERLAQEIDRPVQEVKPVYEAVLAYLKVKARIHDYLPILVSKRVKYLLTN